MKAEWTHSHNLWDEKPHTASSIFALVFKLLENTQKNTVFFISFKVSCPLKQIFINDEEIVVNYDPLKSFLEYCINIFFLCF